MIDYFDISFPGDDFPVLGKPVQTEQPGGARTKSFTEVVVRAASGAPQFTAHVQTRAKRMRFCGSPAQLLQCHNGMGSNDFQALVRTTVELVFETLKVAIPAAVSHAVRSGDYAVHELHVAELYPLPKALIPPLVDNIRRFAPSSLQAVPLDKGIGIRLWPNSRDRKVLIYDKYNYFTDGLMKHKTKLLGAMPMDIDRVGSSLYFDKMMDEVLAQSVRIETRFMRSLRNKLNPLDRGSLWHPETARELHVAAVREIPLQDLPPLPLQEQLLAESKLEHRTLIALWLSGRDPTQFCASPATYYRRRQQIKLLYGIDLSIPPLFDQTITWNELVDPKKIIEPPEWALESGFVYDPERWAGIKDATQYQRAWLHPAPPHRLQGRR